MSGGHAIWRIEISRKLLRPFQIPHEAGRDLIDAEKALYPIKLLCRALRVSRAGYYAWRRRPPSIRTQQDLRLAVMIRAAHERSRKTCGSPRVHAELHAQGVAVSRKHVARLMRGEGLRARMRKR